MFGEMFRSIIIHALAHYQLPSSANAVELLLMIAAHESGGFTYCKQVQGPALGLYQMEPNTFYYTQKYMQRVKRYDQINLTAPADRLVFDVLFATAMARVYLLRIPEPIPAAEDAWALAQYAKQYWNTPLGKASAQHYLTAYLKQGGLTQSKPVTEGQGYASA
jgi:hypothetical protein